MPIGKCKVCGAAINHPADARILRCLRCGTPVDESSPVRTSHPQSAEVAVIDPWQRGLLARIYCRTLIVLMIYVLSTGPLYWAIYKAFRDGGSVFLAKLYYPIVLACQHSDAICNWFDWYVGLWVY